MEGRTVRHVADPIPQRHLASDRAAAATARKVGPRLACLGAALLILSLLAAAAPVGGVGLTSADAARCRYAHRGPGHISQAHARHAVVCLVNNKRRRHGRHPLHDKSSLNKAGTRHSRYMRSHHCFSHQCGGEGNLIQRVYNTSYLPCTCTWSLGEDIAWGRRSKASPRAIVRSWMHSPPHREILLQRKLDHLGIGIAWGTPRRAHARGGIYTADFGHKG